MDQSAGAGKVGVMGYLYVRTEQLESPPVLTRLLQSMYLVCSISSNIQLVIMTSSALITQTRFRTA